MHQQNISRNLAVTFTVHPVYSVLLWNSWADSILILLSLALMSGFYFAAAATVSSLEIRARRLKSSSQIAKKGLPEGGAYVDWFPDIFDIDGPIDRLQPCSCCCPQHCLWEVGDDIEIQRSNMVSSWSQDEEKAANL